jgi:hypothetical protein
MIVDVFGIEAFLPGSQIDVKPIRDYDVFVGKTMEFKVVKINQEYKNVVVSHKALIEAELEQQKKEIISKLEKGQVLEGTVKNITSTAYSSTWAAWTDLSISQTSLGAALTIRRDCTARPEAQRRYPRFRRREEAYRSGSEAASPRILGMLSTRTSRLATR